MRTNDSEDAVTTENATEIELISAYQYGQILKVAGFSQSELAHSIGKSRSHISNVANGVTPIRLRHVEELEHFLGPRLFATALAVVKKIQEEDLQRRQREMLRQEEQRRKHREEMERIEQERRQQRADELAAALEMEEANTRWIEETDCDEDAVVEGNDDTLPDMSYDPESDSAKDNGVQTQSEDYGDS